jgi:glycerol uptake facilitator-like aquaporin
MLAGAFFPGYWYVYLIGPLVGAITAGLVYHYALETKQ